MPIPHSTRRRGSEVERVAASVGRSISFFPDREKYTKTWGPFMESAGLALALGSLMVLWAHRAWPEGTHEILAGSFSPEFLWDPLLLAGIFILTAIPSLVWLILHPLIDARRIDRRPELEHLIDRNPLMLFWEVLFLHTIAFLTATSLAVFGLRGVPPGNRMPLVLGVYAFTHGVLHLLWNRWSTVFSRQSVLNLQSHLYTLMLTDSERFQVTARVLEAVAAFQNSMSSRIGPILKGEERVCLEELTKGLVPLIHTFPPKGGLENMVKLGVPDRISEFLPIIDQLLSVIHSRKPVSAMVPPDNNISRLLSTRSSGKPIHILCACIRNYNRSPVMEAALKSLLAQKGLEQTVTVASGGLVPLRRPNVQLNATLRAKGMEALTRPPRPIPDDELRDAQLILAADVPTALNLALRLTRFEDSPGMPEKIILFTSLDRERYKGQANLPDPYYDSVSIHDLLEQVHDVLRLALLPSLEAATIPSPLIALAGTLLRGFLPGDLPPYQAEKRMRLLLAIAKNDPSYLIHIDRKKYRAKELSTTDVKFLWDDYRLFNSGFLAQLCIRFAERNRILARSPYAKDYTNSLVALHSLLSPVLHQLSKIRKGQET